MSETNEMWDEYKEQIVLRKFDSDDTTRVKSMSLIAEFDENKEKVVRVDTGMMQKVSIVCGVKKCQWFSDNIDENIGVNQEIYNRRMGIEFRRIPPEILDKLFLEVQKHNKSNFDKVKFQKNSLGSSKEEARTPKQNPQ